MNPRKNYKVWQEMAKYKITLADIGRTIGKDPSDVSRLLNFGELTQQEQSELIEAIRTYAATH